MLELLHSAYVQSMTGSVLCYDPGKDNDYEMDIEILYELSYNDGLFPFHIDFCQRATDHC